MSESAVISRPREIHRTAFRKHGAEAIYFADDSTLLIANEATAELTELPMDELLAIDELRPVK